MPKRGPAKQVPEDQRSRGKNLEHPEGQDNAENHEEQTRGGHNQSTPPSRKG